MSLRRKYDDIIRRIIWDMGLGGREEEFLVEAKQAVFKAGSSMDLSSCKIPIECLIEVWVRNHLRELLGHVEGESLVLHIETHEQIVDFY